MDAPAAPTSDPAPALAGAPAPAGPRVVSLLPSATEMLALLGANIVGRSHECDWPPHVRDGAPPLTGAHNRFESSSQMHDAVTASLRTGKGLYWLDEAQLAAVRPDVIVTQSLCSVCAVDLDVVRQAAQALEPPPAILDTNPMSLHGVLDDVRRLGGELGLAARGEEVAAQLEARVGAAVARAGALAAEAEAAGRPRQLKVVFLEWTKPLFPGGHWTPQMIHMAGGLCPINPPRNGGGALPSAQTDPSAVADADPDLIIVAPCGLDLGVTRREVALLADEPWWLGLRAVRSGAVALVDGNQHFNRPGPRLVDALEWLVALLAGRPDLMCPDFPWAWMGAPPPPPVWPAAGVQVAACASGAETAGGAEPGVGTAGGGVPAPLDVSRVRHVQAAAAAPSSSGLAVASHTPRRVSTLCAAGEGAAACCEATEESAGSCTRACPDPWVADCPPWSGAHGLPRDIEDLHAASCSAGKKSYDDPSTGYSVFTEVGLAPRGCCANRCRHCPWGHFKVQGRPRLNRLSRPALLQPNPRARRSKQPSQLQHPKDVPGRWRWLNGPAVAADAAPVGSSSSGSGAGGACGVTLVCYEGCAASEALARELAAGRSQQPVVLLAAFDVDSGALWGSGAGAAATYPPAAGPGSGSTSAGGPDQPSGIGCAMDAALRTDLDLVAVPLQVSGQAWFRDPLACGDALAYVVRAAAALLQCGVASVAAVAQGSSPQLFVVGTAGTVAGGWTEVVRAAREVPSPARPL